MAESNNGQTIRCVLEPEAATPAKQAKEIPAAKKRRSRAEEGRAKGVARMKTLKLVVICFVANILMPFAIAQGGPTPVRQFLLRIEPVRADFSLQKMSPAEQQIIQGHAAYLRQLQTEGTLTLAGQVFDPKGLWGIVVINAPDQQTATSIMEADPAQRSGLFRGVAIPFRTVFERSTNPAPNKPVSRVDAPEQK